MRVGERALWIVVAAAVLLCAGPPVEAGTTGKIRGRVVNGKTKEPIAHAPVTIEGSTLGSGADFEGEYYINNIRPGTYTLRASPIGYVPQVVKNVKVIVNQTTTVDFELFESVILLPDPVIVKATPDKLQFEVPTIAQIVTGDDLKGTPLTSVYDLLEKQAGIVMKDDGLHVRGGRGAELVLVVDQVVVADPVGGYDVFGKTINISGNSVQEVQLKKSGVSASEESGLSGVVAVTTRPGTDSLQGHIEYFTDNFGTDILNKNSFNYDRLQFNLSGPEPLFADRLLPAIGVDCFAGHLKYSLSAGYETSDDYVSYGDYGTSKAPRQYQTRNVLGLFSLTERAKNSLEAHLKLNWQASKQTRIDFSYHYSWDDYTPFRWNFIYTPGTASRAEQSSSILSLRLVHQLAMSAFYEIQVSRWQRHYLDTPSDPNVPGGRTYPGDIVFYDQWESFDDYNGNRVYDAPEQFINVNQDSSWYWGGPFYTVGDAWLYNSMVTNDGRVLLGVWPTADYEFGGPEWQVRGPIYGDWRGADSLVNGSGNSSAYVDTVLTDWNGNGAIDFYESEPFLDANEDGRWNANDYFNTRYDKNGNGRFDPELAPAINVDRPEPYFYGDIVLGEPYTDVNLNGQYDPGLDIWRSSNVPELNQDLNHDSEYDGPGSKWSSGLPFEDLNGNGLYDAPNGVYDYGEPFLDLNGNGKWDAQDGFLDEGYDQWAHYNEKKITVWTANVNVTKQFSKEHEIETGCSVNFDDLTYADLQYPHFPYDGEPDGGLWPDRGAFRDFYHRQPVRGSAYVQDRMEYGSLIANLGLRYDFFIQSAELKTSSSEGFGESKSIAGSRNKLSPRIGVSYPISTQAKVFFNYGHYYQLPELSQMYQRATQVTTAAGIIGNENLDYEKTIQYEVGVSCKLSDDYVLSLSGFYKDEFDKINSVSKSYGPIQRSEYENVDYGRTRGLEMQLEKRYGDYVSGYVNYTYMFAYGKSSSSRSNYFDDFYGRAIPITEFPLDWDERHQVVLNLNLRIEQGSHPELFGLKLPDNCGVSSIWRFGSGFPFTPDKDFPGIELATGEQPQNNSMRYPARTNLDIRAWKRFPLLGLDIICDLWISNLFDSREVLDVYPSTGRSDTNSKPVGASYVFEGDDIAANPLNLGPGRNIRVGMGLEF